jgi:tripartite-type tricarboxylate transporter receptor subunit TctC
MKSWGMLEESDPALELIDMDVQARARSPEMSSERGDGAMMVWLRRVCALFAVLPALATGAPSPAAAADPIADFYSGKTVQVLIGFSPGGGYDIYARTVARYMGRHIPGNPKLVPQNMPGAGSLKAVNYLSSVAPKDGTALAHFAPGVMFEPLLGHTDGVQFEATKFNWLGSASREASVCAFMTRAGIKSWQDMRTKSYVIGASGGGAESDVFPTVLRNMFHLPLKIVTGYPGGTEITLAMERHEVDGRCGWSWTSLLSRSKALLDSNQLDVVLQIALQKTKDLPNVPLILDVTDNAEQKAALKLIVARQSIARPFAAPPGIPADRARALRDAFDATMKDPDFIAEAKSQNLDVDPVTGAEVEALIREVYASTPEAVKLAATSMKESKE